MENQIRSVTVSSYYYPQLSPNGHAKSYEAPFIRLRGLWLRELGFEVGDLVTICAKKGELIITPTNEGEFE